MAGYGYQIGIETELLLKLREAPQNGTPDLERFAESLARQYNETTSGSGHPKMHSDIDGAYEGRGVNVEWSLSDDQSISPNSSGHTECKLCLETLHSLPCYSCAHSHAQTLWKLCLPFFNISQTAAGVRLSSIFGTPSDNVNWDIESLKSICRAIIYFEGAFEVLVPEHRRGNAYAKSFQADHPEFKSKGCGGCFALIEQQTHPVHIADLMNPGADRNYAWNFCNLIYGGKMTIEFRGGPGVTVPEDCLAWVELAVSFARSARAFGTVQRLQNYTQDVQGPKAFVNATLAPSMSQPQLMGSIFGNKQGSLVPRAMPALTAELHSKLKKKKAEVDSKNIMVKKIRMAR